MMARQDQTKQYIGTDSTDDLQHLITLNYHSYSKHISSCQTQKSFAETNVTRNSNYLDLLKIRLEYKW
jgi:hypothetical protein